MNKVRPLTIVFAMLSEGGHYAGTFRLARRLEQRGHRVLYLGIPDFKDLVKAQGFGFIPFAEELLPLGYIEYFSGSHSEQWRGLLSRLGRRTTGEALFKAYLAQILDGPLDECLRSCNPDILLCDTFVWYVALRALCLGIPTIDVSIVLSLHRNSVIPPITTSIRPGTAWWSPAYILAAWVWLRLKFFFAKYLASLAFGRYRFPTRMHHLVDVFKRVARRSGYLLKENSTWWFGEMGPRLAVPEVVLCPRAFQIPGGPEDQRTYLGDFVDLERSEEGLDVGSLEEARPVVYCSLGSSAFFYPHAARFFSAVIAASRLKPKWQFVLHVGDYPSVTDLGHARENLLICRRVPQLTLLKRASVMVTHGGLNSILECIHFGVPMVVVPAMRDQPGNAVRAVYHGIGIAAKMSSITARKLVRLIEDATNDPAICQNLERIKRQIEVDDDMGPIVRLIESKAIPTSKSIRPKLSPSKRGAASRQDYKIS